MSMVKAGDRNMEYYLEGSGSPLLMISGFTAQASGWAEPFTRRLQEKFSTIRYSHRGTGTSDRLDGEITLRDLERIREAFVAQLLGMYHRRIEYPQNKVVELESRRAAGGGGQSA